MNVDLDDDSIAFLNNVETTSFLELLHNSIEEQPNENDRFKFCNDEQIKENIKKQIPSSSQSKSKWAKIVFEEYNNARNTNILNTFSTELMVLKNLNEMSKSDMEFILPKFINDVRKKDGSKYPPESLRQLVCALFHYLRYEVEQNWDFFRDSNFSLARKALDASMKCATKEGLGLNKRKAEFISNELEEKLWTENHLGTDSPKQLLSTLIFLIGINFGLRARKEHRQLRCWPNSQFTLLNDPMSNKNILRYTEDCQKTRNGGLKERNIQPKIIDRYEDENERNVVKIYKKYIQLRPQDGKNTGSFYLQPLQNPTKSQWFKDQPVGENSLGDAMKDLFKEAGIDGHFSNHSLRRSKITRLFQAGVDKEVVKAETGHRSDTGVMAYREYSTVEKMAMQRIIETKTESGFAQASVSIEKKASDFVPDSESIHIVITRGDKSCVVDL